MAKRASTVDSSAEERRQKQKTRRKARLKRQEAEKDAQAKLLWRERQSKPAPKKTCGDFDGVTAKGNPCTRLAGYLTAHAGEGPCYAHGGVLHSELTKYRAIRRKQKKFLDAFVQLGTVLHAARAAKIHVATHKKWLATDEKYATKFAEYQDLMADTLEREAFRRAHDGFLEPVYQRGEKVGHVRKFSDSLMAKLLDGNRPGKFKQRTELSGPNGGPIQTEVKISFYIPNNNRDELDDEAGS